MSMLMLLAPNVAPTAAAIGIGLLVAANIPAPPRGTFMRVTWVANYVFLALNTCVMAVALSGGVV